VICSFSTTVRFSPPLTVSGGGTHQSRLITKLSNCSTNSISQVTISGGTFRGSFAQSPLDCATLASTDAPITGVATWRGTSLNYNSGQVQRNHIYPSIVIDNNTDMSRSEVASFIGGVNVVVNVPSTLARACARRSGVSSSPLTGTITFGVLCGSGGGPITIYQMDPGPLCGGIYNPRHITAGSDGALWFITQGSGSLPGSIGRITTSGTMSHFSVPCGPNEITAGPDGALWFTCDDGKSPGSIVRMTTVGTTTTYSVPNLAPGDIAAGPDGALWFLNGPHSIGQITTSGSISTYSDPGIDGPVSIAAGPDGALWFTNLGMSTSPGTPPVGSIGKITTSGVVTTYYDPSIAGPWDITAGPDGALWFTNASTVNPSIGRITTSGVVSSYPVTGWMSGPFAITSGPDGALWFTQYAYPYIGSSTGSIGRITTGGVITDYTANGVYTPYDITAGPDGALWFVSLGNDSIGRITTP
jgi:virginiamycin B lyase